MSELENLKCEACRASEPPLDEDKIKEFLETIKDWQVKDVNGIKILEKDFKFPNFIKAVEFSNLVAEISEANGHHPELVVSWGRVVVKWWTHKIKGLHKNDFIMAAKTDKIYRSFI